MAMISRADILRKLVEFLEADTEVRVDNLTESLSLREGLGLDSIDLVGIIMRIEEFYRIRLTHGELEKVGTVGDLLDLISAKLADNAEASDSKAA
jgi:acyl carrier protein